MKMEITKIMSEYKPDHSIFSEDDEDMTILKECVQALPPADMIIFLMYSEKQSLREVGKELGVSHTIIYKQINNIRKMMKEWIVTNYPKKNKLIEKFNIKDDI